MELHLGDKLALVTGSTAGIGFAIAKALAAEGARVIVNGRSQKRVAGAVAGIRAAVPAARLESLPLDLAKAEGATETASRFSNHAAGARLPGVHGHGGFLLGRRRVLGFAHEVSRLVPGLEGRVGARDVFGVGRRRSCRYHRHDERQLHQD